jgi:hypothetical protein
VVWDSGVTHNDWWRLCSARDLAAAAPDFGVRSVIVTPTSVAAQAIDLPSDVSLAPVLEFAGRLLEGRDPDGGARGLARSNDLMTGAVQHVAELTSLSESDVLVAVLPSLSECFGLARALTARGRRHAPAVVLYGCGTEYGNELSPEAVRAYWRLAVSELSDAAGGRLTIAAKDPGEASALQARLARPVRIVGEPLPETVFREERAVPRIVCLGHIGVARVRPLLESIAELVRPSDGARPLATIAWRSNQGAWADSSSAAGLACELGVDLLDALTPIELRDEIAGADAVVFMGDGSEGWQWVARRQAQAAGVPFLKPCDSRELVAQLAGILRDGEPDEAFAPSSDQVAQPAHVVLGRLLECATGSAPVRRAAVLSEFTAPHALVTEIC